MTPNKEDYLKCIHELTETHEKLTNKKIAEMMAVSPPATSEMLKKLITDNLIVKDKELGYYLTKQGLLLVSELVRKHRIIEIFLVNHLHYSIKETHEEAEVLEHTVSTNFIDKLEASLNFPKFCPHGGTIPQKGEFLIEKNHIRLSQIKLLGTYTIKRVIDNIDLLQYLDKHDLSIGQNVSLTAIDSYAMTYTLTYNNKELSIPKNIAKQIFVKAI